MAQSKFKFSLRVWHPTANAAEISSGLGLTPQASWSHGDQVCNLDGKLVARTHVVTYCAYELKSVRVRQPDRALKAIIAALSRKRLFLERIKEAGGRIELFVGVFCNVNCSLFLGSDQLQRIAKLRVDLALDVYS